MQTLDLAIGNMEDEGAELPLPMPVLEQVGIKFRRGQLSLIAAAPGGGKSSLATHLAVHMDVPTLYMSADCDRMTVGASVLAGLLDEELTEAEWLIGQRDPECMTILADATDKMWWCFQPSPTLQDIGEELYAFAHVQGRWPELIVIDNLMDVNEPGDELTKHLNIIQALVETARETQAHIMLLHHVIGEFQDGDQPIPRSGIRYKVSDKPRLALTLYRPEPGIMRVCVVKHTGGKAQTKAAYGVNVPWFPERGYFGGE